MVYSTGMLQKSYLLEVLYSGLPLWGFTWEVIRHRSQRTNVAFSTLIWCVSEDSSNLHSLTAYA